MATPMDREAVLARLQQLSIEHETHTHAAVMTCDAQIEALAGVTGACTKNLFLKDKKGRLYVVTALADTRVDLKVLSSRLGTGKGGVRLAPDELVGSVLQVPLGSVTPLAMCQPSAEGVVLLLDQKIKAAARLFVHPLENTTTTVLTPPGLEAFLRSVGREPVYVDLEADPRVDADNPPDLKQHADAAPALAATGTGKATEAAAPAAPAAAPVAAPPASGGGKKGAKKAAADGKAAVQQTQPRGDDVLRVTETVISKVVGAVTAGSSSSAALSGDVLRQLTADVEVELNVLRNAAYASGFAAAQGAISGAITKMYA